MGVPARKDIENELKAKHEFSTSDARRWALMLDGLEWTSLRPIVQVAIASRHPNPVLAIAGAYAFHDDPEMKRKLARQLERIKDRIGTLPPVNEVESELS